MNNNPCTCGCDQSSHTRLEYSRFICRRCPCNDFIPAATERELVSSRLELPFGGFITIPLDEM